MKYLEFIRRGFGGGRLLPKGAKMELELISWKDEDGNDLDIVPFGYYIAVHEINPDGSSRRVTQFEGISTTAVLKIPAIYVKCGKYEVGAGISKVAVTSQEEFQEVPLEKISEPRIEVPLDNAYTSAIIYLDANLGKEVRAGENPAEGIQTLHALTYRCAAGVGAGLCASGRNGRWRHEWKRNNLMYDNGILIGKVSVQADGIHDYVGEMDSSNGDSEPTKQLGSLESIEVFDDSSTVACECGCGRKVNIIPARSGTGLYTNDSCDRLFIV